MKIRTLAIFASGAGSNAENIIRYISGQNLANKVIIVTENPKAYVLTRALRLRIEGYILDREILSGPQMGTFLIQQEVEFIVLAGYLKLVPSCVIDMFPGRIVNIHPALLPKYGGKGMYGRKVHEAVLEAGECESGITIHHVNRNYDEGSIIFQAKCPVLPCDRAETLAERIHELEHEHYPRVIEALIRQL